MHRLRASGVTSVVSSWFAGMVVSCPVALRFGLGFCMGLLGVVFWVGWCDIGCWCCGCFVRFRFSDLRGGFGFWLRLCFGFLRWLYGFWV